MEKETPKQDELGVSQVSYGMCLGTALLEVYCSFPHLYGRSIISPGVEIEYKASKAAINTVLCWATLKGSPRGWPNGHGRNTVRGGFIFSAKLRTMEIPIVEIPASSISL
jgi:hypothetical protein